MQLIFWHKAFPINAQGVSLHDVGIGFQGQKIEVLVEELCGFLQHLAFCNPQGGFCHNCGKIIYFYAVELLDGHLDQIIIIVGKGKFSFSYIQLSFDTFVPQSAEAQIGFSTQKR